MDTPTPVPEGAIPTQSDETATPAPQDAAQTPSPVFQFIEQLIGLRLTVLLIQLDVVESPDVLETLRREAMRGAFLEIVNAFREMGLGDARMAALCQAPLPSGIPADTEAAIRNDLKIPPDVTDVEAYVRSQLAERLGCFDPGTISWADLAKRPQELFDLMKRYAHSA